MPLERFPRLSRRWTGKIDDLTTLRIGLQEKEFKHCLAFTFSPSTLTNFKPEVLLDPPLLAGIPVIWWSREYEASDPDAQTVKNPLKQYLFDQFREKEISNAGDISQIIHDIRRSAMKDPVNRHHLGRHLTFILDNPEREIPQLERHVP